MSFILQFFTTFCSKTVKKRKIMKKQEKLKSAIKPYFKDVWMEMCGNDKYIRLVFGGLTGFVSTLIV